MDNATQMMLARAMSIPLATVLFQSLMGGQQMAAPPVFQPAPVIQPSSQPQSPMMNPALLQMMQQAFQVLILGIVLHTANLFRCMCLCESVYNASTFESPDPESSFVNMQIHLPNILVKFLHQRDSRSGSQEQK